MTTFCVSANDRDTIIYYLPIFILYFELDFFVLVRHTNWNFEFVCFFAFHFDILVHIFVEKRCVLNSLAYARNVYGFDVSYLFYIFFFSTFLLKWYATEPIRILITFARFHTYVNFSVPMHSCYTAYMNRCIVYICECERFHSIHNTFTLIVSLLPFSNFVTWFFFLFSILFFFNALRF